MEILQMIAALATVATGVYSLVAPMKVRGFTGLELPGGRGITEVRAVLGGFFIALGAAPLIFGSRDMFLMLGIAYLAVGVVRAVSMFVDKSLVQSNFISLAVEIILGIILIL
ncbi:MAG: DUF4345 family protein [Anaerolineaceae bacterium]|jgi:hypothetical protein|nr:DUF4345 family protein [Anaerolineaceae bacterium]